MRMHLTTRSRYGIDTTYKEEVTAIYVSHTGRVEWKRSEHSNWDGPADTDRLYGLEISESLPTLRGVPEESGEVASC